MSTREPRPGFALLETLVALTLLSSSLAATGILLIQAMQQEREAASRTAAVRLASSLADQLRSLRRSDGRPLQAVTDPAELPACNSAPGDCQLELTAAQALAAWRTSVVASLPEGSTSRLVLLDADAPSYLIQVEWPSPGAVDPSVLRLAVEP